MKNCMINKLISSVENTDIVRLGEMTFSKVFTTGQSFSFLNIRPVDNSEPVVIEITEGVNAQITSKSTSVPADLEKVTISSDKKKVVFASGTYTSNVKLRIDFGDEITKFSILNKYGIYTFATYSTENFERCHLNIEDFQYSVGLRFFTWNVYNSGGITGNIEKLGKLLNLKMLSFADTSQFEGAYCQNVTGDINTLAQIQVSSGRTEGNLSVICNGKITNNGSIVAINTRKEIYYGSSMTNPTEEETAQGYQIV